MRSYRNSLSRFARMALLIVVLLVPALAIDPLGLNSPAGLTTPVSAQDGSIEGTWSVDLDKFLGSMKISRDNEAWSGQLNLDVLRRWETLINVQFNAQTGEVSFYRPAYEQYYTGTLSGNTMSGRFTPNRPWRATRTSSTTGTGTTTGTGVALVAESRTADPGSTVRVPIRLDRAVNVGSMQFTLTYNAQVLKVNKVDDGSQVSGMTYEVNFDTPPQVWFALMGNNSINGSGSVIYIEFQVIGAAGTSSPLTLSGAAITDSSNSSKVTVATTNGTVTVASATGPGGKLKGDYDGDGKVSERDALAALKMVVKLLPVDLIVDMDDDGEVTAKDALAILKMAVGKEIEIIN